MKKTELKELYQMMFPNYPDIVTVKQLQVLKKDFDSLERSEILYRVNAIENLLK